MILNLFLSLKLFGRNLSWFYFPVFLFLQPLMGSQYDQKPQTHGIWYKRRIYDPQPYRPEDPTLFLLHGFPPVHTFIFAHLQDTRFHTTLFWLLEKRIHWKASAWAWKKWGATGQGASPEPPWCSWQPTMEILGLRWGDMSSGRSFHSSEKLNPCSNWISPGPGQGAGVSKISVVSRTVSPWVPSHGVWKTVFDRALGMNPASFSSSMGYSCLELRPLMLMFLFIILKISS